MQNNSNRPSHTWRRALRPVAIALLPIALSGCASFSEDRGMAPVVRSAAATLDKEVSVIRTPDEAAMVRQTVDRLKRRPLTANSAVQIALLNNRRLQAAYHELAMAEAERVGDSLPPNPSFSLSRIVGGGASELEAQVALDILALVTLPARADLAATRFRQAQLRAIEETLRTAADVRRAYYAAVSNRELVTLLRQADAAAKTTAQLAHKLGETGALNKLDQAREQVFHAETTADLATARQQADSSREELARLLGFWGADLDFRLPETLPALPARPASQPSIEVEAVSRRVDLQIARTELQVMAKAYGLTQATRFINLLDVAGLAKRSKDNDGGILRERGLDMQVQIPLFDFGEVRVRQAEAAYMAAVNRLTDRAITVRSEARDAYRRYRASYDIAQHYQREIIPLRQIITEENQLRFSAMQIDVFALLQEARQRIAALRAAIEAKRSFWFANVNLQTAVIGGGTAADVRETSRVSAADAPAH
ncbi:MAG: TolC family protein [Pseudolabrys sp.]